MRLFLDSSALAKRYIVEVGSDRVLEECRRASEVLLSVLAVPETLSGLNRLKHENQLSEEHYKRLKRLLIRDLEEVTLIDVNTAVINRSIACLEQNRVRTLDAIQIASAMESFCDLFLTADLRQLATARQMNLNVLSVG